MNFFLHSMGRHAIFLYFLCFCFCLGTHGAWAQTSVSVSGTVSDRDGPIYGATVQVKGTSLGTSSGVEGRYALTVSEVDTLVFSYLGYESQEFLVGTRTVLDVMLTESLSELEAVVVNAGYYTVSEKERTGSIASVSAEAIENQPVTNVMAAVQGRMAGVHITQNSGVPGGGFSIQIRGTNSLRRTGNYPMYIIDGVPVSVDSPSTLSGGILPNAEVNPLNNINPNDIESIVVLKDADATAIYGARGANGVVLITTKKGRVSATPEFRLHTSYGWSQVANQLEMMDTKSYLAMRTQAYANDGITTYPSSAYDINGTWDQQRYTNWQEELLGSTAMNSLVQFSVSGGNAETNYFLSGSHREQTTVFSKAFRYKTNNVSGSINHRSQDGRFYWNGSGLLTVQENNVINEDVTTQALRLAPNAPALYQEDGSLNWEDNTFTNPIASYHGTYGYEGKSLNVNWNANYELFPSVTVTLNSGLQQQWFEEQVLRPHTIYNPSYGLTSASSTTSKNKNQQFSYLLEPQLRYQQQFGKHELSVLVGGTYQERVTDVLAVFGYGFESNALMTNLTAASNVRVNQDLTTEYKYAAVFGRLNYQYKDQYILNVTGRRDGSSRFGSDRQFANFGAVGGAWLFGESVFAKALPWLSYGKLRGSYGITGSDAIGDYQYLDTYTIDSEGYGVGTVLHPSRLFNPYFSWEKTTKLEAALELGFWKDHLLVNAAWYRNRSGNQLVGIPLPATTGFSSVQSNLPATVENKGWEIELTAQVIAKGNWKWETQLNGTFPKNTLVDFPGLEGSTYANTYVVGAPLSIRKVYQYEGIDPETGLYQFKDFNDDGEITTPEDMQVLEKLGVQFFGGWSNQVHYKGWDFSCLFQFVAQRQPNYNALTTTPGTMYNQPTAMLDVWSPSHPNGRYMPYTSGADAAKLQAQSRFVNSTAAIGDASFVRLKNVQISYQLPIKHHLKGMKVYVQGQNLWTGTNYFGVDPEFVLTGYLPPMKTYAIGMELTF